MRSIVALWRLLRLLQHIAKGLLIIGLRFPGLSQPQREQTVQTWARQMLGHLGIGLRVEGTPCEHGPMLLVSNHISWLDILVMHAARYCRFVSKSEVRHWPLIGTLATAAGTLYIERESRRDAMRVVHRMAESLRGGEVLAVFPEGTTSDGLSLLPFHANLIQAAVSAHAPVQPLALRFVDGSSGAFSRVPCYIGDDTLVASVWRTLRARDLVAEVRFGVAEQALGRDRRQWAADLQQTVQSLREPPMGSGR